MKKGTFCGLFLAFSIQLNAQSAIDLGLNVYWATCNVGADTPEDIGGYYAWGETEEKDEYNSSTYTYCYSESSFIDIGSDISGTQYDVAKVKWGDNWRMPTVEEIKELISKCTWSWTSNNGVQGVQVTGPNGNSIFLPAGGRKYGSKGLRDLGEYGCYWTSSLNPANGTSAYGRMLLFYAKGLHWNDDRNRLNGMNVRPVTTEPTGVRTIISDAEVSNRIIYSLSGQRLTTLQKGINIIDGRKVIVRR